MCIRDRIRLAGRTPHADRDVRQSVGSTAGAAAPQRFLRDSEQRLMHLSRFDVDPRRRTAARWAASPHAMHAAVMRACNPEPGERVLWRLDRHTSFAELFVVSPREPHPEEILREATDGQPGAFATADYEPFLANIADGQCWRFRLTANPTYASSGSGSGSTRGKVR